MMKVKGIFAVSFIAMMVVGGAYADIASSGYVDEKIDKLATVAKTGAYGDLSGRPTIPTVNNATLTIQKNGTTVDTFTANASANKTINITVPTTTSQLTNNSGFITSVPVATGNALGGVKSGGNITVATSGAVTVNSATHADSATTATKATQDASGNVITETYATKSELTSGLSGKQATLSGAQLNAVNSGITSTKVSTYDGYSAKITAAQSAASAAQTAANGKVATAQGSGNANKAVITNASGNIATGQIASGMIADDAVTSAKLASGAVTSAKIADGTITNTDISASAAIAQSKISGLTTALAGKVATAQGSGNANKAVITNASGNIATGQIASGMIADDAVTSAKLAAGAVDATALASGAVTSAKIADGTITNTDISASAAIDASKISGLSTVATTGSYDDLADKPTIPSAYVLKAATSSALGGVKSAGDITVGTDGAVTVNSATHADSATTATNAASATKASQDASGNVITSTYATKAQITALDSTSTGDGAVVTGVSQTDGKVSVTMGNVQIPFGGQSATDYAAIWVE